MSALALNSRSHTGLFAFALIAVLFHCSAGFADSSKQIRADFEKLQTSFVQLRDTGNAVSEKVTKFNAYLDQLVSAPSSLTGRDLESAATSVSDMSEDQFDRVMEGNVSELSALLGEDEEIRESLSDIDTEMDSISTFLESSAEDIATLQSEAADLVVRIADYTESRTFGAIGLVPLTMKIKGVANDIGEVARVIPDTVAQTGAVAGKMARVDALLEAEQSVGSSETDFEVAASGELVNGSQSTAVEASSTEPGNVDLFNGQWKEADAVGQPAILFLGKPVVGQPAGMVAASDRGVQASLILKELSEEKAIYSDPTSGNLF